MYYIYMYIYLYAIKPVSTFIHVYSKLTSGSKYFISLKLNNYNTKHIGHCYQLSYSKKANNTVYEIIVDKLDKNQSKLGGLKFVFNFFTCWVTLCIFMYLKSTLKKTQLAQRYLSDNKSRFRDCNKKFVQLTVRNEKWMRKDAKRCREGSS